MRRGKRLSVFSTNLSTTRKKAIGVNAPLSQLEWAQKRHVCVSVCNAGFLFSVFGRKLLLAPPGLAVPAGGSSISSRTLLPAQLCPLLVSQPVLAVVFVTILVISFSHSQGRGSNVIHCRKDGTWSGSFHLCREMQGQCALPSQLNSHLKLQCASGYGIGL